MKILSEENPIPQKDYGPLRPEWKFNVKEDKRKIAHEEVCRDLDKSAEQLLIDTHDESLDRGRKPLETISRTMARMASMQLKIQREQKKTNRILFIVTIIAGFAAVVQVILGVLSLHSNWSEAIIPKRSNYIQLSILPETHLKLDVIPNSITNKTELQK